MLDETDIQKLLRLKRYEQPPAGYHEKFLQDFHRRQRSDMLQEPLWKIILERIGAFFSDHSMGRLAYGTATAAGLLFAGIASYSMLDSSGGVATAPAPVPSFVSPPQLVDNSAVPTVLTLGHQDAQQPAALPDSTITQIPTPHYVIDSRPVSYERSFSF